jgi:spore coat polysaccharide biosynthesis protein SpsF
MVPGVAAIIQARMGSERLPGKVLLDIAGETMLERVIWRVRRSTLVETIIVATTTSPVDDDVAATAAKAGVHVTRGSEENVLDRFHDAAQEFGVGTIMRVCADSPFVDPDVCDQAIRAFRHATPEVDYASNKLEPSFPLGLDVEVFSRAALDRTWREATEDFEKAHVTAYIYQHPESFRLLPVKSDRDLHSMRWTVDTPEDLEFARQVYTRLGRHNDFSWLEVVKLLEREPGLMDINSHLRPKHVTEG